jgi:hypothetical protein
MSVTFMIINRFIYFQMITAFFYFAGAVRRNRHLKNLTDAEIRSYCAKFFTGARDRKDPDSARANRINSIHCSNQLVHDTDSE